MALTDRKRKFADAVRAGASNREAAIAAGYSAKTASAAGSRLAKDADVLAHIERKEVVEEAKAAARVDGAVFNIESLSKLYSDPLDFLKAVMNDGGEDVKLRLDAAKAMMPYVHAKPGEKGKKTERQEAAERVATGRFGLRAVK